MYLSPIPHLLNTCECNFGLWITHSCFAEHRSDRCPGGISENPSWINFLAVSSLIGSCRKIKLGKF